MILKFDPNAEQMRMIMENTRKFQDGYGKDKEHGMP